MTLKEFHQRRLDDCPRVPGDEPLRAEAQHLIDAMPNDNQAKPMDPKIQAFLTRLAQSMDRMATDEAERQKVARRLF